MMESSKNPTNFSRGRVNWRAFANGFSVGLFLVVLSTNWDNIFVIRTMAVGIVTLYGILMYAYMQRAESRDVKVKYKKGNADEIVKKAWEGEE